MLEFLKKAFGAEEIFRYHHDDGSVGHAEARIGDSIVMLFDGKPEWPPTPCFLRLFVDDADAFYERALAAGAVPVTRVVEHFFGDRVGRVRDPFGNIWILQTHVADVQAGELARRSMERKYADAMRYDRETLARPVDPGAERGAS